MKSIFINFLLIGLCILLICGQCKKSIKEERSAIKLRNYSQSTIGHYFALGGRNGGFYPDTILPPTDQYVSRNLESNKTFYYYFWGSHISLFDQLPKDTLSVYILSIDTLVKYPWQTIREQYNILQRYDLSLQDLQKLNYTLYYPPTPTMKDMKMWPKYMP